MDFTPCSMIYLLMSFSTAHGLVSFEDPVNEDGEVIFSETQFDTRLQITPDINFEGEWELFVQVYPTNVRIMYLSVSVLDG